MFMDVLMLIFGDEYGKLTLSSCFILSLILGYIVTQIPKYHVVLILSIFPICYCVSSVKPEQIELHGTNIQKSMMKNCVNWYNSRPENNTKHAKHKTSINLIMQSCEEYIKTVKPFESA
jgi:hypothetical protein